jgi:hypothetical protein
MSCICKFSNGERCSERATYPDNNPTVCGTSKHKLKYLNKMIERFGGAQLSDQDKKKRVNRQIRELYNKTPRKSIFNLTNESKSNEYDSLTNQIVNSGVLGDDDYEKLDQKVFLEKTLRYLPPYSSIFKYASNKEYPECPLILIDNGNKVSYKDLRTLVGNYKGRTRRIPHKIFNDFFKKEEKDIKDFKEIAETKVTDGTSQEDIWRKRLAGGLFVLLHQHPYLQTLFESLPETNIWISRLIRNLPTIDAFKDLPDDEKAYAPLTIDKICSSGISKYNIEELYENRGKYYNVALAIQEKFKKAPQDQKLILSKLAVQDLEKIETPNGYFGESSEKKDKRKALNYLNQYIEDTKNMVNISNK